MNIKEGMYMYSYIVMRGSKSSELFVWHQLKERKQLPISDPKQSILHRFGDMAAYISSYPNHI